MTKADQAVVVLSERIRKGEWLLDAPLPPVTALAVQLDVSPTTISAALRKLASKGIVRIRPRLGVFVSMVEGAPKEEPTAKASSIGLCGSYIGEDVLYGGSDGGLVTAIWQAIQESDIPVSLLPQSVRKTALTPERCRELNLAGVVFLGGDSLAEAEGLRASGFPVILGNRPLRQASINYVDYDHELILRDIIRRFLKAGHERIAVISSETSLKGFYRQFKSVYIEEVCDAGFAYLFNHYWKETCFYTSQEAFSQSAETALDELFALPEPPTAIFSFSACSDKVIRDYLMRKGISASTATADVKDSSSGSSSGYQSACREFASTLLEGISKAIENPFFSCQKLIPMAFVDHGTIHPLKQQKLSKRRSVPGSVRELRK